MGIRCESEAMSVTVSVDENEQYTTVLYGKVFMSKGKREARRPIFFLS